MPEPRLEDRFQNILDRALHHAITHCRDTQGSELPWLARFWDKFPSRRTRLIPAALQVALELFKEQLLTLSRADTRYCHPIDPSGATPFVESDLPPGAP
jgi:hypothetical protein